MAGALSQREFAKLLGVSHVQVNRAIKRGRLTAGVDSAGRITDPEAARTEYEATLDLTRAAPHVHEQADRRRAKARAHGAPRGEGARASAEAPLAGVPPSAVLGGGLTENNAVKAYWQARQAELDYRKDAGELVEASEVRGAVEEAFRRCRGKLLALPNRLAQHLPGLGAAGVAAAERIVREALEDLAAEAVKP